MPVTTGWSAPNTLAITPKEIVYGTPATTTLEITNGNCKVAITGATLNMANGYIEITYSLESDVENNGSILPLYTLDLNESYQEMTEYPIGSDGKYDLATSAGGTDHIFRWRIVSDLTNIFKGNCYLNFIAFDHINNIGDTMANVYIFNLDLAPSALTITSPVDGIFNKDQTPTIEGTIPSVIQGMVNMNLRVDFYTDSTHKNLEASFESNNVQTGWQYKNDSAVWIDIPSTGIPIKSTPSLIGNAWRFTVQTDKRLNEDFYYIKAFAGSIMG